MAVKFAIRNYSRTGDQVTFTVVALNADGSVDTNYIGSFTWGLNGMSDPGAAAFSAGDLGQRTYTTTILNPAVRTGLAANFPGAQTGANLSISAPSGTNVSFGNQGDHLIVGGVGNDTLTTNVGNDLFLLQQGGDENASGAGGNDSFYFGAAYSVADSANGGTGASDRVILQGNYAAGVELGALAGVELVELLAGNDTRFGDTANNFYDYTLTAPDAALAAGQLLIVQASALRAGESLSFNGSAETNGQFEIFAGNANDILTGGLGNDRIAGGGSGDTLTGGGGNDTFVYQNLTDSNSTERDGIQDFSLGDRIDLSQIDANANSAGNQSFSFIGTSAFNNTAGQLRYENISLGGPIYLVQADVNGDGVSDLEIVLVNTDGHALTAADFVGIAAPVVDLNGAGAGNDTTAAYTEGYGRVVLAPAIALDYAQNSPLTGATVTIASGFTAGDALRISTGTTGISFDYNALTGVLTLSGTASLADYQTVLATLSFKSASDNPGTTRDITMVVTDGATSSVAAHINLAVTPVDDAPVNTVPGSQTGNPSGTIVFSAANANAISVTDPDADGGTMRVRLSVDSGTLTLGSIAGVVVAGDGTGVVKITGTLAAINAALDGLVYTGAAGYTGAAALTITSIVLSAGGGFLSDTDSVAVDWQAISQEALGNNLFDGRLADNSAGLARPFDQDRLFDAALWQHPPQIGSGFLF